MKNYVSYLTFLALMMIVGCEPNDTNTNQNPSTDAFSENFGSQVSRDFIGQVVDMDNNPVQGATVKIGTSTVQTDLNGVFIINNAQVYQQFAYITAKKSGFIDGSRSMVPTTGKNNVKIMLIPSTPVQTISSGASSEVTLPSGTKVTFDGAFEDENGNAYSGDISVSMYHLETSNENLSQLMPGMLYAETETGEEAVLQTFGMLNVEMRGSGGQKIQIGEGHVADIEMLIDPLQSATAPQTIPLWHFNEENGYWKQEGSATKVGNKYVGEVSHFSWWNCDQFSAVVNLTIALVDSQGNALSNVGVSLTLSTANSCINYTDDEGQISGVVPANQILTVTIFNNCGDSIYTSQIGPFTADTSLSPIAVTSITDYNTLITGSLLSCNNQDVSSGYVLLLYNGFTTIFPVQGGLFTCNLMVCDDMTDVSIMGYDISGSMNTGLNSFVVAIPETDVGNLIACNATSEPNLAGTYTVVITKNTNGQVQTFTDEVITQTGQNTYITSSTAFYNALNLPGPATHGFTFTTNFESIQVPTQNLCNYYTNEVQGLYGAAVDGIIIDEDHFTISYEITHTINVLYYTYTAVYTRN